MKKNILTTFARLERLRVISGKTWNQIAEDLEVDRSLLFHVKAGTRKLSPKVIFRLEQAEILAGISTSAQTLIEHGLSGEHIAAKLLGETARITGKVTVADLDLGYKEVSLEYRRGAAPIGCPLKIRIASPDNATIWKIIGPDGVIEDPTSLLLSCLPEAQSNKEFLNLLTPSCYRCLLEIAMGLAFGPNRKHPK